MRKKIQIDLAELTQSNLVWVQAQNLEGIYFKGKLVAQKVFFEPRDILKLFGIRIIKKVADPFWVAQAGKLPTKLSDVKLALQLIEGNDDA